MKLFQINLHVGRGCNTDMPANLIGAFVPVFVGADDHESAAQLAVVKLRDQGFEFIDISDGKIHELDPLRWDTFVTEKWADFIDHFPDQKTVISKLSTELFFTGPFAGYDTK
ncbi:hypothetical protein [Herbaspirillum lusitanum]|uniref:hypothetical protein n=1 Tax=Herbaspirillum lusitanum TaxID=213312 RepID=UPI0022379E2D|nr:hypothetical protein [Herbaspirillum lusitanum]